MSYRSLKYKTALPLIVLTLGTVTISPASIAQTSHSTNLYGSLGLNTIPSARMDETGTLRAQISTLDPYAHAAFGFQLTDPLFINIRQTGEGSTFDKNPDRLYPAIDLKLRLLKESKTRPEIALGLDSAIGHKRTAGEYIAASKRFHNIDLTAGIGWGRYAGSKLLDNPLKSISNHFGGTRPIDGEQPARTADWFTGEHIGLFAGIEYFTPLINGLSLKADYGGDRYEAEKAAFNYNAPAPWSVGLNYKTNAYKGISADIGIAAQGTDKIMGRLSLQGNVKNIRSPSERKTTQKRPLRPYRTDIAVPGWMELNAEKENIMLSGASTDLKTASARLKLSPHTSSPYQIGRAATHIANHAGPAAEEIKISPRVHNLRGPSISIMRRDLEMALAKNQGSAEEIWHNTDIAYDFKGLQKYRPLEEKGFFFRDLILTFENQTSLAEEDNGILHRNSAILSVVGPYKSSYFTSGLGLRLNISDNLHILDQYRPQSPLPVRSDVDDFADRTLALDTSYGAFTHTIMPDVHALLAYGYLEEMYAGIGGEILFRPFNKRFAIGAESWLAFKRDPLSWMNLGLTGDSLLSSHLNAWYDIPHLDTTIGIKAGRYLAEDLGATLSLSKNFKNGASLEGYVTLSDKADFDLFGGRVHHDHGIKLTIPLGGYKYTPNTRLKATVKPFGRDIGQSLQSPLPLYEITTPLTKSHLIQHWDEVTDNAH